MRSFFGLLALTAILFQFLSHLGFAALGPQRCYYAAGKLASDEIIPCYTSHNPEVFSCCQVGDVCLRRGACFNKETGVAYQYACTDPSYLDERCPEKCHVNPDRSPWAGLVFCNGRSGMPNNTWLCHNPDNCGNRGDCATSSWGERVARIVPDEPVGCKDLKTDDKHVAFREAGVIPDVTALPSRSALSSWWAEFADQTKPVLVATPKSTYVSTTATAIPTGAAAHPEWHKAPSTIGLGVGLGLGIPVLLGIAGLIYFCVRRQRKRKAENNTVDTTEPTEPAHPESGFPIEKKDVAASHGFKAELDGTPSIERYGSPGPSEMQDTSMMGSPYGSPLVSPATIHEGFKGSDEIYKAEGGGRPGQAHEMAG